ncbi:B12-binding domain-containing radical SAM protein, partial [bacterium]|nr:B12-binding domain-containing radical SAM protein [bacterium]
TPYLSIQQLIAATPEEHEIDFIDEKNQKVDLDANYDLIGIMQCITRDAYRSYELADQLRQHGKTVVLGGWHPTALPEEAKQHADSVVIGEQEGVWPTILNDLKDKNLKSFYKSERFLEPEKIPPHQSNIGGFPFPIARVEVARGCPQACDFCMPTVMFGTKLRLRPLDDVIEEIRTTKKKTILFTEPALTLDPGYAKHLFKEMKTLNKKFICYGHTDVLNKDEELVKLSSDAGCIAWWIDFESVSKNTLDRLNKKTNNIEEYASAIEKIHDYGIAAVGTLIFGLDTDTLDVFDKTRDAMKTWEIDSLETNIVTPHPGTPLFDRLDREGRILTK